MFVRDKVFSRVSDEKTIDTREYNSTPKMFDVDLIM